MNAGSIYVSIKARMGAFMRDLGRAKTATMTSSTAMVSHFNKVHAAIAGLAGAAGLGMLVKSVIQTGAEFQRTMATVRGVMRATEDEFASLEKIAKHMGETTEWTAVQAAESLKFLGMAGFEAGKAIRALPGTLDLATAGNIDLGQAADIATNALTAMQLQTEELGRVNDAFVGTITRSNTNMQMMAESFRYAAPVANAFGMDIERLSALIGVLGNAGVQGSMAGTQLAFGFQKAQKVFERLGVRGEGKDLIDALRAINKAGWKNAEVMKVFGMRGGRAALILKDLIPQVENLERALRNNKDEHKELADIMRNTAIGAWRELKSAIEGIKIEAFTEKSSTLQQSIENLTETVRGNKDIYVEAATGLVKFAEVLANLLATIQRWTKEDINFIQKLTDAVYFFFHRKPATGELGILEQELVNLKTKLHDLYVERAEGFPVADKEIQKIELAIEARRKQIEALKDLADARKNLKLTHPEQDPSQVAPPVLPDAEKQKEEIKKAITSSMPTRDEAYRVYMQQWRKVEAASMQAYKDFTEKEREPFKVRHEMTPVLDIFGGADMSQIQDPSQINRVWDQYKATSVKKVEETFSALTQLSEQTANSMQSNFSDFFFDAFTGKLDDLQDYARSIFESIARAASDILSQQLVEALFGSITKSGGGGGLLGEAFSFIGGLVEHDGGVVGRGGKYRTTSAVNFIGAPRLHGGLRPDEMPAILQKGETVLPKGMPPGNTQNITIPINVDVQNAGSPEQAEETGTVIADMIDNKIRQTLLDEMRPGGMLQTRYA